MARPGGDIDSPRQPPSRLVRVTLKDVAENAGVSIGTVSDIVNRGLSKNYASETQERVRAAIRRLGYRPARAAQDLRRGRSNTVGVILTSGFDNPYYARLFNEIKLCLDRCHLSAELMILGPEQRGAIRDGSDRLISHGVDGLIVGPLYYWYEPILRELRDLKQIGMPIATFGAVGDEAGMHNVLWHDDEGGAIAAEYLLTQGHRRIAFLGAYAPADASLGRGTAQQGVERVLAERGLLDRRWFIEIGDVGSYDRYYDEAQKFTARWLRTPRDERPTALLCKTDQIAITVLAALHAAAVAVPAELSVMGYDNVPESAFTVPALTTMDNLTRERAAAVVNDIAQILSKPDAPPESAELRWPQVVARASVGSPAS